MPKKIKSKESQKISFFSKLATLLAPIDEKILYSSRKIASEQSDTETSKEPARRKRPYPEIRPMQVIKI
ncbi:MULTISPECIES: hypothetical protein [Kordiimonas]|jgi:hypothetical protein|uniref:hypothetical protein n=1 Tax=Kordiimonas TaxID=288021 RepID=UPI00257C7470|nr:hypothetical protein [Kordiimonas sp. UBA4487]